MSKEIGQYDDKTWQKYGIFIASFFDVLKLGNIISHIASEK